MHSLLLPFFLSFFLPFGWVSFCFLPDFVVFLLLCFCFLGSSPSNTTVRRAALLQLAKHIFSHFSLLLPNRLSWPPQNCPRPPKGEILPSLSHPPPLPSSFGRSQNRHTYISLPSFSCFFPSIIHPNNCTQLVVVLLLPSSLPPSLSPSLPPFLIQAAPLHFLLNQPLVFAPSLPPSLLPSLPSSNPGPPPLRLAASSPLPTKSLPPPRGRARQTPWRDRGGSSCRRPSLRAVSVGGKEGGREEGGGKGGRKG